MPNELTFDQGVAVSLQFELANPAAGAVTDMTLGVQGGTGFVVPAEYKFHPVCLSAQSNADLTAGTATYKVHADSTEVSNGPEPVLSDLVQKACAVARPGTSPIAAGAAVGVSVTTNAGYLPVTADHTAVLVGVLLPA